MNEGWVGDDYLILFDDAEIREFSGRYAVHQFLPGFQVLGLRGWDEFIVRDAAGNTFLVPTVPVLPKHLLPFSVPPDPTLRDDKRFRGRVK